MAKKKKSEPLASAAEEVTAESLLDDGPKRKKKPAASEVPAAGARRTRFEGYTIVEVHRSQLKNAPYNPRKITDKAKKFLKKKIEKVGLVEPPIWNKRTGHIVGGHQRLAILDALEGNNDYSLHVAQVDMDEVTEKETNIALNNTEMQGEWDLELLEGVLRTEGMDWENAGFDTADVYQMFGDSPIIDQPEALEAAAEKVRNFRALGDKYDAMVASQDDRHDNEFYAVLIFKNDAFRSMFTKALGVADNRYIDGKLVAEKLGFDLEALMAAYEEHPEDENEEALVDCDHCGAEQGVKVGTTEVDCFRCGQKFPVEW